MSQDNITPYHKLAEKWQQGTLSEAERAEFDAWYHSGEHIYEMPTGESMETAGDRIYQQILEKGSILQHPKKKTFKLQRIAAVIFIIGAATAYLLLPKSSKAPAEYANDVAPGHSGATLTLGSGKTIRLSETKNGELAKESGISISKTVKGELVYQVENTDEQTNQTNTLATARGETYQVRLPDGSLVYLNAASSITYAARLSGSGTRKVKLDGEAYFEIAKDRKHPFIVETRGQQVEVLGTHFNVQAYSDEDEVKTTLLEGSVKVSAGGLSKTIRPDQQSVWNNGTLQIDNVDAEDAVAWKNGLFIFEDEPLESIMSKLVRWYDVEVVYDSDVKKSDRYGGSVSRYDHISKILRTLELTKEIHFKIEGRRLTVMK